MNVVVTGGTGFIGSHVVKVLSDNGHTVTILARNADKVPMLQQLPGVSVVACTMNDFVEIEKQLTGKDAMIHIALNYKEGAYAMASEDTLQSVYLFEKAAQAGVKKIIYTSSTAVVDFVYMTEYGAKEFEGRKLNEEYKHRPATYYGATKASCEMYLHALSHEYDVQCNIIRPGYVFGNPIVEGASVQPDTRFRDIVISALKGDEITVTANDGTQFLWAEDIAQVYYKLLVSNLNREIFFALAQNNYTWEEIVKMVIAKTHSNSKLIVLPNAIQTPAQFDVSKLNDKLGLSFTDGWRKIEKHIDYIVDSI